MNISEIEKKFDEEFDKQYPSVRSYTNGALQEFIKSFLRSEISALLESLKGVEIGSEDVLENGFYAFNQATEEFNQRINKAKE